MNTGIYRAFLSRNIKLGSIPPYIYAYPTRASYRPLHRSWTINEIWKADEQHSINDLNLYIHVPFCRYKCGFCNLYTVTSSDQSLYSAYIDAICKQLELSRHIIEKRNLRTIYIGGGTPSLLDERDFQKIFRKISQIYPNWKQAVDEVCCEATPDSIVDEHRDIASFLVSLGFTRINMGVQSLDSNELKEAGRARANELTILKAFERVRKARVPNLSTDLIMGFSQQTNESWSRSVDLLAELGPETISTYFLTVRPDAWFSRTKTYRYAREPELYKRYDYAATKLLNSGYIRETNIRYKKPGIGGYLQKLYQFRGMPYLGIGAGARSYTNTVDYLVGGGERGTADQLREYIDWVDNGSIPIRSGFEYTDEERIRKRLVLGLIDLDVCELNMYGYEDLRERFEPALQAVVDEGLAIRIGSSRYQLTELGFKHRDIISWMFASEEVTERDREFYRLIHEAQNRNLTMADLPSSALVVS
ncbi:MAG: coproporphyrinogen-III oxidase family protein [Chloroflexi bacterium]|nr:coproporphyrinogen-III oxidase family protein [Chloroflexota bacterium]